MNVTAALQLYAIVSRQVEVDDDIIITEWYKIRRAKDGLWVSQPGFQAVRGCTSSEGTLVLAKP